MLGNVWSIIKGVYEEFGLFFKKYDIDNSIEIRDGRHFFRYNDGGKKKTCEYVPKSALKRGYIKGNYFIIDGRTYDIAVLEETLSPTRVNKVQDCCQNLVYKIVDVHKDHIAKAFDCGPRWFSTMSNRTLLVSMDETLGGQKFLQSEYGHYTAFSFQVRNQYDNSRKILLTLAFLPLNYVGAAFAFVGRFFPRMVFEKIGDLFSYFSNIIYARASEARYTTTIFKKIVVVTSGVLLGTISLIFFSVSASIKFSFCLCESLLRSPMVFVNAFINDNDSFEWRRGAESLRAPVLNFTKDVDYIIKKSILLFQKTYLCMAVSTNDQLTKKFNIKELEDIIEELNKSRVKSNSIAELGAEKIFYGTNDQLDVKNNEMKKLKKEKNEYISKEQLQKPFQAKELAIKENSAPSNKLSGSLLQGFTKEKSHRARE